MDKIIYAENLHVLIDQEEDSEEAPGWLSQKSMRLGGEHLESGQGENLCQNNALL